MAAIVAAQSAFGTARVAVARVSARTLASAARGPRGRPGPLGSHRRGAGGWGAAGQGRHVLRRPSPL